MWWASDQSSLHKFILLILILKHRLAGQDVLILGFDHLITRMTQVLREQLHLLQ